MKLTDEQYSSMLEWWNESDEGLTIEQQGQLFDTIASDRERIAELEKAVKGQKP